jgi:hypothetical protein
MYSQILVVYEGGSSVEANRQPVPVEIVPLDASYNSTESNADGLDFRYSYAKHFHGITAKTVMH